MANITVDIDLDEFETDDLISEVLERLDTFRKRKQLSSKQRVDILESVKQLYIHLASGYPPMLPTMTIEDQGKIEVLLSVWDKYTSWELDKILNK